MRRSHVLLKQILCRSRLFGPARASNNQAQRWRFFLHPDAQPGKGHVQMKTVKVSLRLRAENPNHHLWNNNGTWFVHYTTYPTEYTKERVRESLKTKSLAEARQKRDELLGLVASGQAAEAWQSLALAA